MKYPLPMFFVALVGILSMTAVTSDTIRNTASVIFSEDTSLKRCLQEIEGNAQNKSIDTYKIQRIAVNADERKDIIVQNTDTDACGSVGCIYEICLVNFEGEITRIPFGFAAQTITVSQTINNGMHDIILNGNGTTLLQWDGEIYRPQLQ